MGEMEQTIGARKGTVRPRRSWFERTFLTPSAARITAPVLFLVAWQLIAPLIPSLILPMPAEVVQAMWEQLREGTLVEAFSVSLLRLAIGFALALVVGSIVGLAMGLSPRIEAMLHDFVVVGLTFPDPYWGPLVAMWFGDRRSPRGRGLHRRARVRRPGHVRGGCTTRRGAPRHGGRARGPRDRATRHSILPSLSPFFFASSATASRMDGRD